MAARSSPVEHCHECGFDAAEWNDQDTTTTLHHAGDFLRFWSDQLDDSARNRRPSPDVWSVVEYADHVRETLFGMRFVIDSALGNPGSDLGVSSQPAPSGQHRQLDYDLTLAAADAEAHAISNTLDRLGPSQWVEFVIVDGSPHTITWATRHAVHDMWHHLTDIAQISAGFGFGVTRQHGRVDDLSVSSGGVPKNGVDQAAISRSGMEGDNQNLRLHHGRPFQALCLWSSEVIADLVAEGHPVHAGAAGENITIAGINWADLHAGAIISIGEMTCQLSSAATPCAKNDQWFADNDSSRIEHTIHPGFSRWYASVLTPGVVSRGDHLSVSPAI